MPVLESPEIGRDRDPAGARWRRCTSCSADYRDHVLAVRIGATDLSGQYGLRRSREHTVYDVALSPP